MSVQSNSSDSPFGSLDISFSKSEVDAYESEKKQKAASKPKFPGGLVRVRLEKKGRGGKSVTVFYDFEKHQQGKLPELLKGLKKTIATGGKIIDNGLELQGDQRKKAAQWLIDEGYKVKGQIS
jgi:translation initiation factor 1